MILQFLLFTTSPKVIYLFREGDTRTTLMKKTKSTYSHICKIINGFEDKGIMGSEKRGRETLLHLSEKGKQIQDLIRPIMEYKID